MRLKDLNREEVRQEMLDVALLLNNLASSLREAAVGWECGQVERASSALREVRKLKRTIDKWCRQK